MNTSLSQPALWNESRAAKSALCFAVAAAAIAVLLTVLSLEAGSSPPGCGSGSGCEKVLSSRWSSLLGIPVGVFASLAYVGTAMCLFLPGAGARKVLQVLSVAILGALLWFVILQLLVIRAFCPYCMLDHILGLLAVLLLWKALSPWKVLWPALGAGCAASLVALQLLTPQALHSVDLPVGKNFDVLQGSSRVVGLMQGSAQFQIEEEAHFGKLDAERMVLIMVDYACPHCRRLHHAAKALSDEKGGELCVVVLPTPIHPDCNPAMREVPERFDHSCEIAALSLALQQVNADAWAEFDSWLFESEEPRGIEESRAKALPLLGDQAETQISAARERISRNTALFENMPLGEFDDRRVPVTWWVHQPPVVGPIDHADLLWERAAVPADVSP